MSRLNARILALLIFLSAVSPAFAHFTTTMGTNWTNSLGKLTRTQSLFWDARKRLHGVTDLDTNNNGYTWSAVYDALGRRFQTATITVTNNISVTNQPHVISQYYDPTVEFLELGVTDNNVTSWKIYGPDANGRYGGMNGVGGLDAIAPGGLGLTGPQALNPVVSDFRGNGYGMFSTPNNTLTWYAARISAYGGVPGNRPLPLGEGAELGAANPWQGAWMDITGLYYRGARYYDPIAGCWRSHDPIWDPRNPNGFTLCGGEPLMTIDADGRCCVAGIASQGLGFVSSLLNNYANNSQNPVLGPLAAFEGQMLGEGSSMLSADTYINGAANYANNVGTVYQNGGTVAAVSYAATSWNMGGVEAAIYNQNQVTGQPLGDWLGPRGTELSGGVGGTAGVAAGGLSLYNWANSAGSEAVSLNRPYIRNWVMDDVEASAPRSADGRFIDPNTLMPTDNPVLGHKPGYEFWRLKKVAEAEGVSQKLFNETLNNPEFYQIEDQGANASHAYEEPPDEY